MNTRVRHLAGAFALLAGGAGAGESGPPAEAPRQHWADASYEYLTTRADRLAQRIDSFFAEPDTERESADSVLRLMGEYEWDEDSGTDTKVRLRGKVDLPELDRRLSIVLGEDDDFRRDVGPPGERQDSSVGLQYRIAERPYSRLNFSVGTNASLEFRSALRYRYQQPIGEDLRFRLTERLYFKEDDGFGTLTRTDLDYHLGEQRIVRLTGEVDYGEETDGAEWATRLSYYLMADERKALSGFGAVSGRTDPGPFTDAYALGVRYRRSVFRPWMFVELEPSHQWRKSGPDEPREPAWVVTFRVEFLEELQNRRAGP